MLPTILLRGARPSGHCLFRQIPRASHQPIPRSTSLPQIRTLIAAPKPNSGPLLTRRSDRALPEVHVRSPIWRRTLPIFGVLILIASVSIFNYQKLSSPVISGTLYALRTSPKGREALGDNIYFDAQIPWIGGGMNQVQGKIDVRFDVRGTKGKGTMRFVSVRPTARGMFETEKWTLTMEDGREIDLLEEGDPFKALVGGAEDEEDGVRGYRQMNK